MLLRTFLLVTALVFSFTTNAKEWLIDVRTANEYSLEHAEGAANIEYQQIVSGAQHLGIQKQDTIRVYCRSGRRAGIARESLLREGYQKVENLGSLQEAESWIQTSPVAVTHPR